MRTYALYGRQGEMLACGLSEQEAAAFIAEAGRLMMRRGRLNAWILWLHGRQTEFAYGAEMEAGAWRPACLCRARGVKSGISRRELERLKGSGYSVSLFLSAVSETLLV